MSSNQTANDYTAATFMTIEFPGFGLDTLDTTGNMTVNSTAIIIGNSSVGYLTNSSIVIFGDLNNNSSMNSSSLLLGNITSNTSVNSSEIYLTDITANLLIMNSSSISLVDSNSSINCFINTTSILVDFITANSFVIGNSTVNISINSTTSFGFAGNSTINTTISNNALTILDSSVPGNAILNSTTLFLGNSTVNVIINSTTFVITGNTVTGTINNATYFSGEGQAYYANVTSPSFSANISVGSNVFINTSVLEIGNSILNTKISSNSLIISGLGNAVLNNTTLFLGNSTVNSTLNSTSLVAATFSGTANNSTNFAGQGQAYYANVTSPLFTTSISIGNSTVNVSINSTTSFGGGGGANLVIGNSTVNTTISNNAVTILGSATVGNAVLNSTTLFIGNSTINSILNSTTFTGTANNVNYLGTIAATSYQLNSTLAANVATMTSNNTNNANYANNANNTTNFAGQGQAYYANVISPSFSANISVGSNVFINTSTLFLGNSTVNVTINSTTLFTGIPSIASISALEAISLAPNTVIYLNSNGRSGYFVGSSANLVNAVANDVGQGIYVAPSSANNGANGAWVRQYTWPVSLGFWGATGDATFTYGNTAESYVPPTSWTGTDNAFALANFGMWARWQSSQGISVHVYVPPPTAQGYIYNLSNCANFNCNIKKLIWDNNGALWQNIANAAAGTLYGQSWSQISVPGRFANNSQAAWLINQTVPGTSAFSLLNQSDSNNLIVDTYIMLSSLDVYYYGYPPTAQNFEYLKIWEINNYGSNSISNGTYSTSTGIISLFFATAPFGNNIANTIAGAGLAINSLTGTGAYASLNGTWPVTTTSSNGTTINLQGPIGAGVATITGGTLSNSAIITVEGTIRYQHLTDYPDDAVTNIYYPIGKARVFNMNTGVYPVKGPNPSFTQNLTLDWDVFHEYNDMNVGAPLLGGIELYWSIAARKVITNNWVGTGFSESQSSQIIHNNPTILIPGQPDKSVESVEYRNIDFHNSVAVTNPGYSALGFEAPFNFVRFLGGKIRGGLVTGSCINFYAQNVDIDKLSIGGFIGFCTAPVFVDCRIGGENNFQLTLFDGAAINTIDNLSDVWFGTAGPGANSTAGVITIFKTTNITANGTWTTSNNIITMSQSNPGVVLAGQQVLDANKGIILGTVNTYIGTSLTLNANATTASSGSSDNITFGKYYLGIGNWNVVPGMTINLTSNGIYTGTTGNAIVLKIFEDDNYIYIVTTAPFATLPAWSDNKVYLFRNSGGKFIRCTGHDTIRQASAAYEKGLDYWEYKKFLIGGAYSSSLLYLGLLYGNLTQVTITPLQLGSSNTAYITIQMPTYQTTNNFVTDTYPGLQLKIYIGTGGQRVITQNTFTGNSASDEILLGGVSQSYLPTNRVVGGYISSAFYITTSGANLTNWQAPMTIIEFQTDCGITRKVIPTQYDVNSYEVLGVSGLLT